MHITPRYMYITVLYGYNAIKVTKNFHTEQQKSGTPKSGTAKIRNTKVRNTKIRNTKNPD